jgi:hypothetical protein
VTVHVGKAIGSPATSSPDGAVSSADGAATDTTITIEESSVLPPAELTAVAPAYDFDLDGLVFAEATLPVRTIPRPFPARATLEPRAVSGRRRLVGLLRRSMRPPTQRPQQSSFTASRLQIGGAAFATAPSRSLTFGDIR